MYSQGLFSIGGIASGLDTSGIIDQLMQLERQPVTKLQSTQAELRRTDDAWVQVNTRLTGLRAAVDGISRPDRFAGMVAVSSSNTDAVTVAKSGTSGTGSVSFSVTRLATAHEIGSGPHASASTSLGLTGPVTLMIGSADPVTLDLGGDATLEDVAKAINAQKAGVTAAVVKVADADHRLVVTSRKTGAANTVAIDGLGTFSDLRAAGDAEVTVGTGAGAISVVRSSNTITDLVPGATITLKKETTDQVTVTAEQDIDAGVAAVKSYVDALNSALRTLKDLTAYNADTKTSGALQGDPSARQLMNTLRTAVTAPLGGGVSFGSLSSAFDVGMSVDRHGVVQLDQAKLRTALESDFEAVGRLFSRVGTATSPAATAVVGTETTVPGTYAVVVSEPATVATISQTAAYSPPAEPITVRVTVGSRTAEVQLNAVDHDTAEKAAAALQDALTAEAMPVTASVSSEGGLSLTDGRYGSAAQFTVAEELGDGSAVSAFGLAGTHAGTDVVGTIDGQAANGTGRELSATAGPATGLRFTYSGAAAAFDVTYSHGLAGGMGNALKAAEGTAGLVSRARKGITDQIAIYQTRIDAFDLRLATRESTLRRQFTAMETAMGAMNAQMSWLSGQLQSLNALPKQ